MALKKGEGAPAVATASYEEVKATAEAAGFGRTYKEAAGAEDYEHVPTGFFLLDLALGGGWARGQQHELIGKFHSGKSTLLHRAKAEHQLAYPDQACVEIDVEHTWDAGYARLNGCDADAVRLVQPETGEQAVNSIDDILGSVFDVGLICFDSLAAVYPEVNRDKDARESNKVGSVSQLTLGMCNKVRSHIGAARNDRDNPRAPIVIFANQWSTKITRFGGSKIRVGSERLPSYWHSSVELFAEEVLDKDPLLKVDVVTHVKIEFEVLKNKAGNTVKTGVLKIVRSPLHPRGIGYVDQVEDVWTFARAYECIRSKGSKGFEIEPWGTVGSKAELCAWLEDRPHCYRWLQREIISRHRKRFAKRPDGWYAGVAIVPEEALPEGWE